jgi:hypothetical protein
MKKHTLAAFAIAGSAMLGVSTAAPAMAAPAPANSNHHYKHADAYPDYTKKANHWNKKADYWGDHCWKIWPEWEDDDYRFDHKKYFKTVVVKAGRQLTVYKHFYGKKVWSENDKDIDWIIVCKPSKKHHHNYDD